MMRAEELGDFEQHENPIDSTCNQELPQDQTKLDNATEQNEPGTKSESDDQENQEHHQEEDEEEDGDETSEDEPQNIG